MLHLTLDTSASSARDVQDRLDDLAQRIVPSGNAAPVTALLAHGHLLHDLLPANNSVLKALFAVPQRYDREAVRTMILARQRASRAIGTAISAVPLPRVAGFSGVARLRGIQPSHGHGVAPPRRLRARACQHLDALYRRRTHGPRCAYGRCTRRHGKMCWCRPRVFSDRGLVSANLQMAWASRGLFARLARSRGVAAGPRVSVVRWRRSCSTHQRLAPRGSEGCPSPLSACRAGHASSVAVQTVEASCWALTRSPMLAESPVPVNSACYGWRLIPWPAR